MVGRLYERFTLPKHDRKVMLQPLKTTKNPVSPQVPTLGSLYSVVNNFGD